jgi:hypothetical protein
MVAQMYVEFQIPQKLDHPYPIVMIHGGGQTGTNFTGTPDGREGWAQFFLRRGYAVYVVDQVARGRSANWGQAYGAMSPPRISFVEQRFVGPERAKLWPQAHLHTQWPGAGEPGDPVFDQFYASQVPSIAEFAKQQELNRDAGAALLDRIGPAMPRRPRYQAWARCRLPMSRRARPSSCAKRSRTRRTWCNAGCRKARLGSSSI